MVLQLTAPVKWAQSVKKMIEGGAKEFIELGPGNVLQGLVKKKLIEMLKYLLMKCKTKYKNEVFCPYSNKC